ncbi:MAG: KTSC domain-containing protein [Lentisphaerae bacterium]|nr:KTSC domain-containing protein [Lentisphaerota bacterium]
MKRLTRTEGNLAASILAALALAGCVTSTGRSPRFLTLRTAEIYSIRYEPVSMTLTVVTRTGDVVDYSKVDPAVVDGLLAAEDKDAFFRETIKGKIPSKDVDVSATP